jgi:esterase/lipase
VLTYDFRGYGDSQGERAVSMNALDLSAAVNFVRQQGATQVVLLGASMGGTASLKVAASVPVAAVVTLSAPADFGVTVTEQDLQGMGGAKLFINSQFDTYSEDTSSMYAQAQPPKEIQMYKGTAHGTDIFDNYETDLTWRILNFLEHYAPPR